jgi:hypothetical protein
MVGCDALAVALTMLDRPNSVKLAQVSRLPSGITFLLEIAAGDSQSLGRASQITGRSEATLQRAAGFFIEQLLLQPGADNYRLLGCDRMSATSELRRNMALIMRWLHPDVTSNAASNHQFSRSVFANRITQAWETVKTDERRAAYDRALAAKISELKRRAKAPAPATENRKARFTHAGPPIAVAPGKRLVMRRVEAEGFWSRLCTMLGRGR